ncbi:hypothetical protein BSL78_16836 [Apostichopus japonicus]|uniref:Uncharacterized protein n=1 Tax=Stichopus japonicus TaxID=307972 RepID=A0A2G8KE76_STIJA|nr:hypothetical protein BSL78_16836 [Apostichopus japonicus]
MFVQKVTLVTNVQINVCVLMALFVISFQVDVRVPPVLQLPFVDCILTGCLQDVNAHLASLVIAAQMSVTVTLMHVTELQENVLDAARISGLIYFHPDVKKPYSLYMTGIITVTGNKTNPGTQWSVTCRVEELQQNSPRYTVFLSQSMDFSSTSLQASSSLTAASNRAGFIQRGSTFTTTDAQAGETYYCVIAGFAWLNTTLSHYDLPIISESPEIVNMSQTSVTIEWRAWMNKRLGPGGWLYCVYRKDATVAGVMLL